GGTLPRAVPDRDAFVESLMDTHLYSVGAYFVDSNPDLADDVVAQAAAIEDAGLERYAQREGIALEAAFQTLVTGLAVRYYRAVSGRPAWAGIRRSPRCLAAVAVRQSRLTAIQVIHHEEPRSIASDSAHDGEPSTGHRRIRAELDCFAIGAWRSLVARAVRVG